MTAIDVLLEPGSTMLKQAEMMDARLLKAYSNGFQLDDTQRLHITLVQRFVHTGDLDKIYAAANMVHAGADLEGMELEAIRHCSIPENGAGLERLGKEDDRIIAWRGAGVFWGRERTVVVTYNPRTAVKQRYNFDQKLLDLQEVLYELRSRARAGKAPWNQLKHLEKHYFQACAKLYLPTDLYRFDLEKEAGKPKFVFRKDYYRIARHIERFGKNIIVSDHTDWSADEIVKASLDRYKIERHSGSQKTANSLASFQCAIGRTERSAAISSRAWRRSHIFAYWKIDSPGPEFRKRPQRQCSRCAIFTPASAGATESLGPKEWSKNPARIGPLYSRHTVTK